MGMEVAEEIKYEIDTLLLIDKQVDINIISNFIKDKYGKCPVAMLKQFLNKYYVLDGINIIDINNIKNITKDDKKKWNDYFNIKTNIPKKQNKHSKKSNKLKKQKHKKQEDKKQIYTIKEERSYDWINRIPTKEQIKQSNSINNIVYRFIDTNGEIIYVGKAENLLNRLNGHKHLPDECYHRVARLEYCKFDSYDDLYLAEPYFIAKWKPEYNQDYKNRNYSFSIAELEDKEWKEFNQGVKILKHKHSQAA